MAEANSNSNKQQALFIYFFLAVIPLLVFWRATFGGFVDYDDGDYVMGNKQVQAGLTWDGIKWAFTTGHASNWHPLTWISHMLDCQIFAMHTGGHHLTSVLLHVINGLLLFLLLRKMTGAMWRSAFVAALFALHPLRVESVAWISERKDVLSTLFWLLTTIFYVRYVEKTKLQNPKAKHDYAFALLFFALGLLSKPMLVTLPFALLLLDFWPLGRIFSIQPSALNTDKTVTENWKLNSEYFPRLLLEKLPFLALAITSSVITFIVQKKGGAVSGALTLGERISNALISYCRYIFKLLWPAKLSVLYPHPGHWPAWQVAGAALVLAAISFLAIQQWRKRPYIFSGWFWFLGTLIPVIGIIQVGIQSMADRYTYVPMIGLTLALVWLVSEFLEKLTTSKAPFIFCSALVLLPCSFLTWRQIGFWKNTETLFSHAVQATDKNYLAYNNLGFYLANHNRMDEAIEQYQKSLQIKPNYEEAQNNLGHALAEKGLHRDAIEHYRIALKIKPDLIEAHNNLGNALSEVGQVGEAIEHYNYVLKQKPDHVDANNNLGVALAMSGKLPEGIVHIQRALDLDPNSASAHSNMGNAMAVQQKMDEAILHYRAALKIKPDDAKTHNNLANALAGKGKLDEAIEHYNRAVSLESNNPEAHFNLGIALIQKGNREDAIRQFEEAVRQKPDYAAARERLAALRNIR